MWRIYTSQYTDVPRGELGRRMRRALLIQERHDRYLRTPEGAGFAECRGLLWLMAYSPRIRRWKRKFKQSYRRFRLRELREAKAGAVELSPGC